MSNEEVLKKLNLTPTQSVEQVKTKSQVMWDLLKNVDLNMFGLKNQTLEKYCDTVVADPNQLTLKLKANKANATGIVSILSQIVSPKYSVEVTNNFIIVREEEVD